MSDKTQQLQGAILGVGNPLLDISAEVPLELLEKYGLSLNNAILADEKHLALYSELVEKYPVQYIAGGATQNSIRVAQWMSQIPGSTAYMGAIGSDTFGEVLERCCVEDGVLAHYMKNTDVRQCLLLYFLFILNLLGCHRNLRCFSPRWREIARC
jgi:adenosine kinase